MSLLDKNNSSKKRTVYVKRSEMLSRRINRRKDGERRICKREVAVECGDLKQNKKNHEKFKLLLLDLRCNPN